MKTVRYIILFLTITATVIICGFMNISAGYAFCCLMEVENHENIILFNSMGIGLLLSSLFLITATVIAFFKKILLPLVFNILGSICYIYTVSKLYAIPSSSLPKNITEPLAERHLLTVIVTLLLITLIILNYFDDANISRRNKLKALKIEHNNRKLSDDEKIL